MEKQFTYSNRLFSLKNLLLGLTIGLLPLLGSRALNAQSPQYFVKTNQSGNIFPFQSTSNDKCQFLFTPSDFNSTPSAGNITKIFFNPYYASTSTTYTNFTVKISMTTLSQFPNATFITGLSTAVAAQTKTFTNVTVQQWLEIDLDNPIYYDGSSNFIVEISQTGYSGNGFAIYEAGASGSRRIYGAASSSSGVGNDTERPDFGFDVAPAVNCNTVSSFPSSATALADPESACLTDSLVDLSMDTSFNYTGITYNWQKSPTGLSSWTDVGNPIQNSPDTTVAVTTPTWFRCQVMCHNTVVLTSDSIQVLIVDPQITSTQDAGRCGPGSVQLSATASVGTVVKWYDDEQGGTPLYIGDNFNTPSLSQTDTFWVEAAQAASGAPDSAWIDNGTGNFVNVNPFYTYAQGDKLQYLIKASEMQALGFTAGTITSLTFECGSGTPSAMDNFELKMGQTNATALTTVWETGLSTVYSNSAYMPQIGFNRYDFTAPFQWDGTSNIVVETCFNNTTSGSPYLTVKFAYTTFTATHYAYENGNSNFCAAPGGLSNYTHPSRANMKLTMTHGCRSTRQPVIATISGNPIVDLGSNIDRCVDKDGYVLLDPGTQPAGSTFAWDDATNSPTRRVYDPGTYYVTVTNQYGCSASDTVNVILKANPVVDLGNDTSVCIETNLTLDAGSDGNQYFWSTGATTQTITTNRGGTYTVQVRAKNGCVVVDSITITKAGHLPHFDGIQIMNNGFRTFVFNSINATNTRGYAWDFGDGSPTSNQQTPTHSYLRNGNYIVILKAISDCGYYVDSMSAHIFLGINKVNLGDDQLAVYPNPTKGRATIEAKGVRMERVIVYNVLGQKILDEPADNSEKHTLDLRSVASGVYTIYIDTNKGVVVRKLSVEK